MAGRRSNGGIDVSFTDPVFRLEIAGQDLSETVNPFVTSVEYESVDGMADMGKFVVQNENGRFTDSKLFQPGNEVNIAFGYGSKIEHVGRIVIAKPEYDFPEGDVPTVIVMGYTKDFAMMDNEPALTKTTGKRPPKRSFPKGTLLSDIVDTIAEEYDFNVDFAGENISLQGARVQKAGVSDYDFIRGWANYTGYVMWVDGDADGAWTLHFIQPDETAGLLLEGDVQEDVIELVYNRGNDSTLWSFRPEYALRNARNKIVCITRNPDTGKTFTEIVEDVSTAPDTISSGDPRELVQEDHKSRESQVRLIFGDDISITTIANKPFTSSAELGRWARQWFRRHQQDFIEGRGRAIGIPAMMARQQHRIVGLGTTLDGDYYFPRVRHVVDENGYDVDFHARKVIK